MNKSILIIFYVFSIAASVSCKSKNSITSALSDTLVFNDSITSSGLILRDDKDGFFRNLQPIDVALQMKDNLILLNNNYLSIYQKHLKTQVSNFTESDKIFLNKVYQKVLTHLKSVTPYVKASLSVSKIKADHYGEDVFYTRGNVIFFPESIFVEKNEKKIVSIFLHELWHILSEQNPDLKDKMYELIGFSKHGLSVTLPPQLEKMLLSNPDGGDRQYAMKLKNGRWLIPLIRSNSNRYNSSQTVFYNYIQFDVFYLNEKGVVEMKPDLSSTVTPEDNMEFFLKIKDNTQYIIHPDEIMADNFMLAVLANDTKDFQNFSSEGQKLLKAVINLIKDHFKN